MKKIMVAIAFVVMVGCNQQEDAITGPTIGKYASVNDFFSEDSTYALKGTKIIKVEGEVMKPQRVNLQKLYMRTVTSKEVSYSGDSAIFKGAFRYDGYSLCDIVGPVTQNKDTKANFYPTVDMYIMVLNDKGDTAVFSWGEIYYSSEPHSIIIATHVSRVIPGKTKEKWTLPTQTKLIVSNDLYDSRNIENPTRIIVKSLAIPYRVDRRVKTYGGDVAIMNDNRLLTRIGKISNQLSTISYRVCGYGHGKGYKGQKECKGVALEQVLSDYFAANDLYNRRGLIIMAGADGYRAVYSFSEIMNRGDGKSMLLSTEGTTQGRESFSVFTPSDFFIDRSVKALKEIRIVMNN